MPHATKFRGPNGSTLYFNDSVTGPGRWEAASNKADVTLIAIPHIIEDEENHTERVEFGFKIGWTTFGHQEPAVAAAYGNSIAEIAEDAEYFAGIIARTDAAFTPERARELLAQTGDNAGSLEQVMNWDDVADALRAIAEQD